MAEVGYRHTIAGWIALGLHQPEHHAVAGTAALGDRGGTSPDRAERSDQSARHAATFAGSDVQWAGTVLAVTCGSEPSPPWLQLQTQLHEAAGRGALETGALVGPTDGTGYDALNR